MTAEPAGVLRLPEALEFIPAGSDPVTYSARDAEFTTQLMAAMTRPVTDEQCPYGPAGGLHSPACFCNLSPSTQATIAWEGLIDAP